MKNRPLREDDELTELSDDLLVENIDSGMAIMKCPHCRNPLQVFEGEVEFCEICAIGYTMKQRVVFYEVEEEG